MRTWAIRLVPVLLLLAVLTWSLAAAVPTARPEEVGLSADRLNRVTELMRRHIEARTFTGAVTLVARHGRVAHFEAHGSMDVGARRPMQRDAIFGIMSMTKPVVAVAILMLVEDGRIRLTDPVSRFVPELRELTVTALNTDSRVASAPSGAVTAPLPSRTVAAERAVTVRDLLTHTSGLMSGGASASRAGAIAPQPGETLAQVIPRLKDVPLDFQPGTRWAYSGQYGFDVLARIVEVASGMSFDRFTQQRIFDPLGMKETSFYPAPGQPRVVPLYQHVDGVLQPQPYPGFMNGAYFSGGGGLFSTATDYLQFAQMLLDGGQHDGVRLLSPGGVALMTSVAAPDTLPGRMPGEGYGLGVRVVSDAGARTTFLSKGSFGWSGAFNTHFFIDPQEHIVGLFMTQVANLATRGEVRTDFETAVMQAVMSSAATGANGESARR
jgi:CubicO group peptidase (beta-lactamase class C family)